MSRIAHGGRLDEAVARYGGKKEDWLDLSTGINAKAWSVPELATDVWTQLPDEGAMEQAKQAARQAYHCSEHAHICLAPGSQAIIQLLPHLYKPQPVAIVGFTYQEHSVCWQRAGHEVYVTDGLESAEATARIVIVVNPNNPDGKSHDPFALAELARRLAAKGGLLVVDEAFCDQTPELSVASEAGREGLLVLRSVGKFYGLAGIRFGAALTFELLALRLEERLGEWAVSGPALAVASAALADKKWQVRTSKTLSANCEAFVECLANHGFQTIGSTGLFALMASSEAPALAQHLIEQKILVRQFEAKPDWLRFGIPTNKRMLKRVDKALASFETPERF